MRHLFVYGTLLQADNYFGKYLLENSILVAKGKIRGSLYEVNSYPGAVFNPRSETFVHGSILLPKHLGETLRIMDEYEGFGEEFPKPNEFTREMMEIEAVDKMYPCWVYQYNLPVDGLASIASGDYIGYIAGK